MIVIGEKVNATREKIGRAIEARDDEYLTGVIQAQDEAGADYIDLNAGTGSGALKAEIADLSWLIDVTLEATAKPLGLDSGSAMVLAAALGHLAGRRQCLLNSVKGEPESLAAVLPLAAEHGVAVIALAMDEAGIARDVESRVAVCERIMVAAARRDIPPERIYFDPLVLPVVTDLAQPTITCECLGEIKRQLPEARTVVGLSNVSHGLPRRQLLNQAFLLQVMMQGADAAILDPTLPGMQRALVAGRALCGHDRHCRGYARAYRRGLLSPASQPTQRTESNA